MLAITTLTAGFVFAGFATHPVAYAASEGVSVASASVRHGFDFVRDGKMTYAESSAATVGDFLRDQGIVVANGDYVSPSVDVPLSDGIVVTYRPAVAVTIATARSHTEVVTSAEDVGTLLDEAHVRVGPQDEVQPSLDDPVPANGTVRITRVLTWERSERRTIAMQTIHRLDSGIAPGSTKVVARGSQGERSVIVRFVQRDGGPITATVIASHVVRKPHARIIAEGVDEYEAFAMLTAPGVARSLTLAERAMQMVATAYTAGCAGCSGITASGRPAGHGIVAVDPSVIPLGTRLYIPGYGLAIAGDTGGAIRGYRIDLGFNSERDALLFGRREVTVYRLK